MEHRQTRARRGIYARAAAFAFALAAGATGVTAAQAASLGKLEIVSGIGEPFRGRIEVIDASRRELDTLGARLASEAAYRERGLAYAPALQSLRFSVAKRHGGRFHISVTSSRPFSEPVVDLLVELAWFGGTSAYAYTGLVDPAGSEKAPTTAAPIAVAQAESNAEVLRTAAAKREARRNGSVAGGAKRGRGDNVALTERIRQKEEQVAHSRHRLAAAEERIAELQQTVREQEQLLTMAAAHAVANAGRVPEAVVTRVVHEAPRPRVAPAPAAVSAFGDTQYVAGGAAIALLGGLLLVRRRRRRSHDADARFSPVAPVLHGAS